MISSMIFWLRWGGGLFALMGLLLFIVPRFMSVPERAELRTTTGKVVGISFEAQDRKSSLPPSARLHVSADNGETLEILVHPRQVAPVEIATFQNQQINALHDRRSNAYELIVSGQKLLDYDTHAGARRETLAGIPLYGAVIAALGILLLLAGLFLFGGSPAAPAAPIPTRRRAPGGGFGQR